MKSNQIKTSILYPVDLDYMTDFDFDSNRFNLSYAVAATEEIVCSFLQTSNLKIQTSKLDWGGCGLC